MREKNSETANEFWVIHIMDILHHENGEINREL